MKALGCQPVESTSLSKLWFQMIVNLHPYNAGGGALAEVRSVSEENVPVDEELTKLRSVSDENVTVVEPPLR